MGKARITKTNNENNEEKAILDIAGEKLHLKKELTQIVFKSEQSNYLIKILNALCISRVLIRSCQCQLLISRWVAALATVLRVATEEEKLRKRLKIHKKMHTVFAIEECEVILTCKSINCARRY